MHEDRVRVEVSDHVAVVTMVRSDRHNALDQGMVEGLLAAQERLAGERGVRAVVLTGEGPSFCSGLDIPSFMTGEGMGVEDVLARSVDGNPANVAQRLSTDWGLVPAPVIAAIHGACFGGGLQIALGCDLRIAAPGAKLSVMEVRWGLIPDMGITRSLPRLVALDVAKELTYTGRRVSGEEARALGLVTRVAEDPLAAALELAREVAAQSPDSVQRAKRLYDEAWGMDAEPALALEEQLQRELLGSRNQMEAVRAGFAKEPGSFEDPEPARAPAAS